MHGDRIFRQFRCLSKKISVKGHAEAMNRPVGYAMPAAERDASPLDEGRGRGVSYESKQVLDGATVGRRDSRPVSSRVFTESLTS